MKILVCVKQVRDPDGPIRIDGSGQAIAAAPDALFRMNRFDEFALEAALQIREEFPGTRIDALTAGPARAARTVRRALETGADEGIHLLLEDDACRTPFEIASLIGAFAHDRHYDLILTGVMAEDDMQAQVGPMLAEILGYPWATAVMALQMTSPPESAPGGAGQCGVYDGRQGASGEGFGKPKEIQDIGNPPMTDGNQEAVAAESSPPESLSGGAGQCGVYDGRHACGVVRVERELEGGRREAFALTLPALLTIQSGANRPRYPALSHVLRARSQALITISRPQQGGAEPGAMPSPRERIVLLEEPVPLQTGLILAGSPEEKAEALLRILRDRAFTGVRS
jgi:electron transfer flavoprotein alpha/beta subunit